MQTMQAIRMVLLLLVEAVVVMLFAITTIQGIIMFGQAAFTKDNDGCQ